MRELVAPAQVRWLSVVIPTLNEERELPETLARAWAVPETLEVLVSDGGSSDGTAGIAAKGGARLIQGSPGRGIQMRRGAEAAVGDVIVLVHADTWLPVNAGVAIARTLKDPQVVGGAFYKRFRDPHWIMRGSRPRCWPRMFFFGFAYGDQAWFARRRTLAAIGGVPAAPFYEERPLAAALRRAGKVRLARAAVSTSARRFHSTGVLRLYWRIGMVNLRWALGASPDALKRHYEKR